MLATGLRHRRPVPSSAERRSSETPPAKPGFAVAVAEDTGGGAAAPDVPPDWGTVLQDGRRRRRPGRPPPSASPATTSTGRANGTGPNLYGVVGRKPGSQPGFAYSDGMKAFGAKQPVWDYEHLYEFLKGPQAYIAGTKMTFVGLKQPQDRINVIAYLHTLGSSLPIPAPNPKAAGGAAPAASAAGAGAKPGATPAVATPPGAPAPAKAASPTPAGVH